MSMSSMANSATARRPDFAPFGKAPRTTGEIAAASETLPPILPSAAANADRIGGAVAAPVPPAPGMAGGQPAGPPAPAVPPAAGTPLSARQVDATLNVLFGYIPIEVITLYVAVIAALTSDPQAAAQAVVPIMPVFLGFLVATPIIFWLVYAAKLKARGKNLPLSPGSWPVWEMFAATVAFAVWAFALPQRPADLEWYTPAVSGVAVLIVSTLLGLLAPFFQRELDAS